MSGLYVKYVFISYTGSDLEFVEGGLSEILNYKSNLVLVLFVIIYINYFTRHPV